MGAETTPCVKAKGRVEINGGKISVAYAEKTRDRIECAFDIGRAADDYIFFPAAAYDGNRFEVKKNTGYPPEHDKGGRQTDGVLITDVPRLEPDGGGAIELTTGDVSVPCAGVFRPSEQRAYFVWTVQQAADVNLGLAYSDGIITVSCPARRSTIYTMAKLTPSPLETKEFPAGTVEIPYRFDILPCSGTEEFFNLYFARRKCMGLVCERPLFRAKSELNALQTALFDSSQWCEEKGCYTSGADYTESRYEFWQAGWVGGSVTAYAMLLRGGRAAADRVKRTLDFLLSSQTQAGLFYYGCAADGTRYGSGYTAGTEKWLSARAAGDILYYTVKCASLLESCGEYEKKYDDAMIRLADALCLIFEREGCFGQIIDCETGEIVVRGSSSGAIIPAALIEAYRRYGDGRYMSAASKSGLALYGAVRRGYVGGGPGDELQCADSESAYAMVESMVALYEEEGGGWLGRAVNAAALLSTWVVPYDYVFPADSTFGRMGMKTTGTVFANLQNKHSAPGICTYSCGALKRLSEYTGDGRYEQMRREIVGAIPQYMATDDRPIPLKLNGATGFLRTGSINERVNMSDWEGVDGIGEIFGSACWSGVALLLTDGDEVPQ